MIFNSLTHLIKITGITILLTFFIYGDVSAVEMRLDISAYPSISSLNQVEAEQLIRDALLIPADSLVNETLVKTFDDKQLTINLPDWFKIESDSLATLLNTWAAMSNSKTAITNWLQHPATPIARLVRDNFWKTILILTPFFLIAEGLLIFVIIRFRKRSGQIPATFHENPRLEIFWTIVPAIALIMIAIPAYNVFDRMQVPPESDLVIEVVGHQFFWEYRYPASNLTIAEEPLVVPAHKVITLNCTSVDVVHSFWVPAFGIKQDCNPGRLTHTWFNADEGVYKGQCAELCGEGHAEMLILVKVVPEQVFERWVQIRKERKTTPQKEKQRIK